MATKKAASAKKSTTTKAKHTTTKVTTVKAVAADKKPRSLSARLGRGRSPLLGACIAEFIGTFILATVAVLTKGEPLYVGFSLIAVVLLVGTLSGSHVNPLVTIGSWATRKINTPRAVGYLVAQFLGATLALVVMTAFIGAAPQPDAQQASMYAQQSADLFKVTAVDDAKVWYVFFSEMLAATVFGFAFSSAMRERHNRAARAFTIGFGYLVALIIGSVLASYAATSGVVNPALAVTLSAVDWTSLKLWSVLIYVVSPVIGGVLGFFLFDVLRNDSDAGEEHLLQDEYRA